MTRMEDQTPNRSHCRDLSCAVPTTSGCLTAASTIAEIRFEFGPDAQCFVCHLCGTVTVGHLVEIHRDCLKCGAKVTNTEFV
jgi:hypothetical protein